MSETQAPKHTPFVAWLVEVGEAEAARILGVSRRRARSWRYRERKPRFDEIPRLIARAGGDLRLESFFEELSA